MPFAGSDVIIKILNDLDIIKWKLSDLEHRLNTIERLIEEKTGLTPTTEEGEPISPEEQEEAETHAMSTIVAIRQARMAVYGYRRLLQTLGLPEHVDALVLKIDSVIAMLFRLQQTIVYTQAALELLDKHPYLFLLKMAAAGGMFALALVQGSRVTGG